MKRIFATIAAVATALTACEDEAATPTEQLTGQEACHEIAQTDAIRSLRSFLSSAETSDLKSLSTDDGLEIMNVIEVKRGELPGNKALAKIPHQVADSHAKAL